MRLAGAAATPHHQSRQPPTPIGQLVVKPLSCMGLAVCVVSHLCSAFLAQCEKRRFRTNSGMTQDNRYYPG